MKRRGGLASILSLGVLACGSPDATRGVESDADVDAWLADGGDAARDARSDAGSDDLCAEWIRPLDPAPPVPSPDPIEIDRLRVELLRVDCDRLFRCASPTSVSGIARILRALLGDTDRCVALLFGRPNARWDFLVERVIAGAILYDGAEARRCVESLAGTCPLPSGALGEDRYADPACRGVFEGTALEGAACRGSAQCAGDAYCDSSTTCPGVCRARTPIGDSCDVLTGAEACARTGALDQPRCRDGVCIDAQITHDVGLGDPCGLLERSGFVERWASCAPGLFCTSLGGTGRCEPWIHVGEVCRDRVDLDWVTSGGADGVCTTGSICFGGSCERDDVYVREAGDECDGVTFCNLLAGLECVEGRCARVSDGTCGAPCRVDAAPYFDELGNNDCGPGLICDGESATCLPPKARGDECDVSRGFECASDTCADGVCSDERCY